MTKEELARKKGTKTNVPTQTAAEALLTGGVKDAESSIKAAISPKSTQSESEPATVKAAETVEEEGAAKKNTVSPKTGRPKGRPYTKISVNVPDEYMDTVSIAAGVNYKGNTSSYIVSLIEKDLKANGKMYQQIKTISQS